MSSDVTSTAGVVLAGGAASRLGGVDKPMLRVGGSPLLHKAVAALVGASPVVVVGPQRLGLTGVLWTREDPPGSGPVAALAAGLRVIDPDEADLVAVLAADLTGVTAATVARLRAAVGDGDGAVLVDADGRQQWLTGVWRLTSLRAALPAEPENAALRATLGVLSVVDVPAEPGECDDVDTHADLDRALGRETRRKHR